MSLRKILFWLHLIAGVVAGVVILIMSVTGAAIAFEKQTIAAMEGEVRRVTPPATNSTALTADELLAKARESQGAKPSGLTLFADPTLASQVSLGRTNSVYVNPHTGEIQAQGAARTRAFMRVMTDWHRWLGRDGDGRAVGKAITGACNAAFLALAVSGIYLWWPRRWSLQSLKAISLFRGGLRGTARDWNWHNVIGIWSAPVVIVLTATGMVISYRWASDLVYRAAGSTPPPPGAGPAGATVVNVPMPLPGTKPLGYEQLLAVVREQAPQWEQITLRLAAAGPRGDSREGGEMRNGQPQAITVTVKERAAWPLFANVQFTLDPHTGDVLKRESYADQDRGRRARSWARFLHTGEALGIAGQAIAALASVGGAVLVWTGLALSWRRFIRKADR